jgi:hypothetical protein
MVSPAEPERRVDGPSSGSSSVMRMRSATRAQHPGRGAARGRRLPRSSVEAR